MMPFGMRIEIQSEGRFSFVQKIKKSDLISNAGCVSFLS